MTVTSGSGQIVIAGGSGFLGVSLATHLAAAGKSIVILSRNSPKPSGPWKHVTWDARTLGEWRGELDGAAGLVNLVGRSVDCIKTPDHRDEILRSRLEATRVLGLAVRALDHPPPVWVQMSTAHIYGDPPFVICTEESPFGLRSGARCRTCLGRRIPRERSAHAASGHPANQLCDRPRSRRRRRSTVATSIAGAAGVGRQGWARCPGNELDSRDGHESTFRAGSQRSGHARRLHRIVTQSGLAAGFHASTATIRHRYSDRTTGIHLDGSRWGTVVLSDRPGARALRTIRRIEAAARRAIRISVSTPRRRIR